MKGGTSRMVKNLIAKVRRRLSGDASIQQVAKKGVLSLIIKVAGALLSLSMFAAVANSLSASDFGRFGFAFSLAMTLAMVASLGLHTSILRWRSEYETQDRPALADAAERWSFNMTSAVAIVVSAIVILSNVLGLLDVETLGYEAIEGDSTFFVSIAALLSAMAAAEFTAGALRARGYTVLALAPRDVLWRGAVSALALLFVWHDVQVGPSEMMLNVAGLLAAFVLLQIVVSGLRPGRPGAGAPLLGPAGPGRSWLRQATPMWGTALLNVAARHFEVVLLGLFVTPTITGAYFASLSLAQGLMLTLIAANMAVAPLISRLHFGGDPATLQKMIRTIMAFVAPAAILGFAVIAIWGRPILSIFDPVYRDQYEILLILAAGATANALFGPTEPCLNMTGREKALLRIKVTTSLTVLVSQLVLIPAIGALGAAIPAMCGILVWNSRARFECLRAGIDPSVLCLLRSSSWRA